MSIEQDILNWDGKSSTVISAIYDRYCNDDFFLKTIVEQTYEIELQRGATWLIKQHMGRGHEMASAEVSRLVQVAPLLQHWESKLHFLQCLPYLAIEKDQQRAIEFFLRHCITDINKFVRAWAYNGLYELACQYPKYKPEVMHFFDMAMKDESPSVKARIKNILKKGF